MIANPTGVIEATRSLEAMWEEVQRESVCDWVENNVSLPSGAITGRVSLRHTPYLREILERFADKSCRHLTLAFASQTAKSSALIWGLLYKIARDPEDCLFVMSNMDQSRSFVKERLHPYVRTCEAVKSMVPMTAKGAVDRGLYGYANLHFSSCVLNFVGAGSPANLASRPRGFIICDETDKMATELGYESGALQLVDERAKSFPFPFSVKASTPTTSDRMIWAEYEKSDRREYWLPCPRCGEDILLKFKIKSDTHGDCGLRWWQEHPDEARSDGQWDFRKVRANAHYKCQKCGGKIHSFERPDMLEAGKWKAGNERAEAGRAGYHLSSLYSILGGETSLGSIAVKFLLSKGSRSDLLNFVNGWLGEPFNEEDAYDFKEIKLRVFKPEEIPDEAVPIMAADCQELGYWVLIRRFQRPSPQFPHGQSWLLFAGFCQTIEEMVDLQREYGVQGENVTLDMAYRPNQVARDIIKNDWRGVWGSDTKRFQHVVDGQRILRPYSVPQFRDPMLGTSWANRTFKRAVFVLFSKHEMLDIVASLRYSDPPIWHCTVNTHPDYSRHLNSRVRRKEKNKRTGKVEWRWHELHQSNHLFDTEVHVTLRALQLGLLALPNQTERANAD
jgi:DNA-directed RNA polymerase subunit RPC12/RpoP